MSRRTSPQSRSDDVAFPVRIKIAVPRLGLGRRLDDIEAWLRAHVGRGGFACHSAVSTGTDALAIHFLNIEDAARFLAAFPDLELANGTLSAAYSAPGGTRR